MSNLLSISSGFSESIAILGMQMDERGDITGARRIADIVKVVCPRAKVVFSLFKSALSGAELIYKTIELSGRELRDLGVTPLAERLEPRISIGRLSFRSMVSYRYLRSYGSFLSSVFVSMVLTKSLSTQVRICSSGPTRIALGWKRVILA